MVRLVSTLAILGLATLQVAARDERPNLPYDPNTTPYCTWWWDNNGEYTCKDLADGFGIPYSDLSRWNPSLTAECGNWQTGKAYCIEAYGEPANQATTTAAPATTISTGNGIATPTPVQAGIPNNCNKWHLIKDTTTCQGIIDYNKILAADFYKWNPSVGASCQNLWLGYYACVGVVGSTPVTTTAGATTTSAGNGIATPTPVQAGIPNNCNKWHLIKDTTTCQGIIDYNKILAADFYKWNPAVGASCQNLWLGYYACVGVVGSTPVTTTAGTTTSVGNGIATPTPVQAGIPSNCNKWHLIKDTTTCQGIIDYNKILAADFYKWNPAVGASCQNLWLGYYACVGVVGSTPVTTTTTTTSAGNGIATPTPVQAGIPTNCNKWHLIKDTTTCQGIIDYNKILAADFYKWNPSVGSNCQSLWLGYYACVGVIGSTTVTPPATTTKPGNGIATPTPVQSGIPTNCNKWHLVKDTTTCQGIIDYNKITAANFYKWNPAVGSTCNNLWLGYYQCVGTL